MSLNPSQAPKPTSASTAEEATGFQEAVAAFRVGGMDCPSCAESIRHSLGKLEGVSDIEVDLLGSRLRVSYLQGQITKGEISNALSRLGFSAEDTEIPLSSADKDSEGRTFEQRYGRLSVTLASGFLFALGITLDFFGAPESAYVLALALSILTGAWYIAPRGMRAALNGTLDMNTLMTISAVGAAVIGEWAEGASVVFLFSLAQLLESRSIDRARNSIKSLMELSPAEATVLRGGKEMTVAAAEVRLGEVFLIRPGQKIPLDGEVIAGSSAVNQAPITGESQPVEKEPGAEVFAGSINEQGVLQVRVSKLVADTTLARIIHAVEEAQASRAPSQSFVERFARVYTPAVVLLAVFISLLPPLIGLGDWSVWFYRALAMLVIACPCALVISTPVTIVSALAGAARAGILIKGGLHLENAAGVTAIAIDKTGTLTEGRPTVTDVRPLGECEELEVLRLAAAIEKNSEHPLARSIIKRADESGISIPSAEKFKALIGRGVEATVEGEKYYLGSERFCRELGLLTAQSEELLRGYEQAGKTAVILTDKSTPLGIIAIADCLRPEAPESIAALRRLGIQTIVMLTGDNKRTAHALAEQAGTDAYHSELLPDDKAQIVRKLEHAGERVAFVGDGVNDAPALATATVGMAMGAAGTDIALETADIALMADDLSKLPLSLRFSRKAVRIIKQNIAFSIAIKAVFIVLALFGQATLWMAVVADMGATLAVIANGLRALRVNGENTR